MSEGVSSSRSACASYGKTVSRPDARRILECRLNSDSELDTRTASPRPGRPTHGSQIHTRSDIANLVSPPPLDQALSASTQQPSSMSIDSLVQPGTQPQFGNAFPMPVWIGAER